MLGMESWRSFEEEALLFAREVGPEMLMKTGAFGDGLGERRRS